MSSRVEADFDPLSGGLFGDDSGGLFDDDPPATSSPSPVPNTTSKPPPAFNLFDQDPLQQTFPSPPQAASSPATSTFGAPPNRPLPTQPKRPAATSATSAANLFAAAASSSINKTQSPTPSSTSSIKTTTAIDPLSNTVSAAPPTSITTNTTHSLTSATSAAAAATAATTTTTTTKQPQFARIASLPSASRLPSPGPSHRSRLNNTSTERAPSLPNRPVQRNASHLSPLDQKVKMFLNSDNKNVKHISIRESISDVNLVTPSLDDISTLYHSGCWKTCLDSVKKFKESENGPRPIDATGAEEELVALLLRYEIVCLLRLNKPHDAKEILVETTIDIQHRATSTASTVGKIDLLLLSLEVLHRAGETLEAITSLYLLLKQEEELHVSLQNPDRRYTILVQLSGYLVQQREYESAMVLQERMLTLLNCNTLIESCLNHVITNKSNNNKKTNDTEIVNDTNTETKTTNSSNNSTQYEIEMNTATKIEHFIRAIIVLLHTARVQLCAGDPRSADRLVDVVDCMVIRYGTYISLDLNLILQANVSLHRGLVLFSSNSEKLARDEFVSTLSKKILDFILFV